MAWKMWGDRIETADIAALNARQKVKHTTSQLVRVARIWLIKYADPVYTDLTLKIYSVRNDTGDDEVGKLLYTSETILKATIDAEITEDHGAISLPFEFNYESVKENEEYFYVLDIGGYTGDETSHWAWRKGWPDPIYRENIEFDYEALGVAPRSLGIISDDL